MKYLLLLYSAPNAGPQADSPESMEEMQQWFSYTDELAQSGVLVGGEPLQGTETATTVRERDGETLTTDGPFAETKEVLGGYYLIDVPDLDQALSWAAKTPLTHYGSVEVRPLLEIPPM